MITTFPTLLGSTQSAWHFSQRHRYRRVQRLSYASVQLPIIGTRDFVVDERLVRESQIVSVSRIVEDQDEHLIPSPRIEQILTPMDDISNHFINNVAENIPINEVSGRIKRRTEGTNRIGESRDSNDSVDTICPVCQEEILPCDTNIFKMDEGCNCNIFYHYQCITQWLSRNPSCPTCRK